ncbi:MAG: hypothetical protein Q9181_002692 [Wetmoreana brouardii]
MARFQVWVSPIQAPKDKSGSCVRRMRELVLIPTERPTQNSMIKPNIGHSEAASGVFAVMKAALMTEAEVIPGVAHFQRLNPASKEVKAFEEAAFSYGAEGKKVPTVGYLFTGQGAQWSGMGVVAMSTFPSFLQTIRKLDLILRKLEPKPSFTLLEVLLGKSDNERFNDAVITQPLCTALQIAIVGLLAHWGIEPTVTYAAGLISAPEAIVVAFYRGFAVKHHTSSGGMLAVGLGVENASKYLPEPYSDVTVACENSPNSVTLSGQATALREIKKQLDADNVFTRELRTGKAYHSPHREPVSAVYDRLFHDSINKLDPSDFAWQRPRVRMVSSVTGQELTGRHIEVPYWSNNLGNRVRFNAAVSALGSNADLENVGCMTEIGPHLALSGPFKQICVANNFNRLTCVPTLVRNTDDAVQLLSTAGMLFLQGFPLKLQAVNAIEAPNRTNFSSKSVSPLLLVDLPTYQWNYEKTYWAEPRPSAEQRSLTHPRHDILGSKIAGK